MEGLTQEDEQMLRRLGFDYVTFDYDLWRTNYDKAIGRQVMAMYDYDPSEGPNKGDHDEWQLKEGQVFKLHSDQDEDGFYVASPASGPHVGKLGYVASTLVEEHYGPVTQTLFEKGQEPPAMFKANRYDFVRTRAPSMAEFIKFMYREVSDAVRNEGLQSMFDFECVSAFSNKHKHDDRVNRRVLDKSDLDNLEIQVPHLVNESIENARHNMSRTEANVHHERTDVFAQAPIVVALTLNKMAVNVSTEFLHTLKTCCMQDKRPIVSTVVVGTGSGWHALTLLVRLLDGGILDWTIIDSNADEDGTVDSDSYYFRHVTRVGLAAIILEHSAKGKALEGSVSEVGLLDMCGFQGNTMDSLREACMVWTYMTVQIIVQHNSITTDTDVAAFMKRVTNSGVDINHILIAYMMRANDAISMANFGITYHITDGMLEQKWQQSKTPAGTIRFNITNFKETCRKEAVCADNPVMEHRGFSVSPNFPEFEIGMADHLSQTKEIWALVGRIMPEEREGRAEKLNAYNFIMHPDVVEDIARAIGVDSPAGREFFVVKVQAYQSEYALRWKTENSYGNFDENDKALSEHANYYAPLLRFFAYISSTHHHAQDQKVIMGHEPVMFRFGIIASDKMKRVAKADHDPPHRNSGVHADHTDTTHHVLH